MLPLCDMYNVLVCIVFGSDREDMECSCSYILKVRGTERDVSFGIGDGVQLFSRLGSRVILSSGDHCLRMSLACLVLVAALGFFACFGFLGIFGESLALRGVFQKGFADSREGGAFREVIVTDFPISTL